MTLVDKSLAFEWLEFALEANWCLTHSSLSSLLRLPSARSALLSSMALLNASSSSYAVLLFIVARLVVFCRALFFRSCILALSAAVSGADREAPSRTGR